jgi:hypothetical protein
MRDNWKDIGGDRFTQANQNSRIDCGARVQNWGNDCVAVVPNWTNGNIGMSPWHTPRWIAATASITKDVPLHESVLLHFRLNMSNPFKWSNWNQPGTAVDVSNISNYNLNFGKGLGAGAQSSWGGDALITAELALKW